MIGQSSGLTCCSLHLIGWLNNISMGAAADRRSHNHSLGGGERRPRGRGAGLKGRRKSTFFSVEAFMDDKTGAVSHKVG